jgi:hypothetical protein
MADKTRTKAEKPTPSFSITPFLWGAGLGVLGMYAYVKRSQLISLERQVESAVRALLPVSPPAPPAPPVQPGAPVPPIQPGPPALARAVSVTHQLANERAGATDYRTGDHVAVTATAIMTGSAPMEYRVVAQRPAPDGQVVQSPWVTSPGASFLLDPPSAVGIWKIHVEARAVPSATADETIVSSTDEPITVVLAPATGAAGRLAFGYGRQR